MARLVSRDKFMFGVTQARISGRGAAGSAMMAERIGSSGAAGSAIATFRSVLASAIVRSHRSVSTAEECDCGMRLSRAAAATSVRDHGWQVDSPSHGALRLSLFPDMHPEDNTEPT